MLSDLKTKVTLLGALLDKVSEAESLNAKIAAGFAELAEKIKTANTRPKVLFVLSLADNRIVAGGAETSANLMIELAGAENIAASFKGYKPISAEAILALPPDAILMMNDGGPGSHAVEDVFAQMAFADSPAAKNGALIKMSSSYLLGLGPRTADAATELARKLHPELKL